MSLATKLSERVLFLVERPLYQKELALLSSLSSSIQSTKQIILSKRLDELITLFDYVILDLTDADIFKYYCDNAGFVSNEVEVCFLKTKIGTIDISMLKTKLQCDIVCKRLPVSTSITNKGDYIRALSDHIKRDNVITPGMIKALFKFVKSLFVK